MIHQLYTIELERELEESSANYDLAMIVIDYLQLMQVPGRGDNRVAEISEISDHLRRWQKN